MQLFLSKISNYFNFAAFILAQVLFFASFLLIKFNFNFILLYYQMISTPLFSL